MENSCHVTVTSTPVCHFPEVSEHEDPCEIVFYSCILQCVKLEEDDYLRE